MKTNFKIASFTEIEFKGILLDLHNNFDFFADQIEISENKILLHFKKSSGDWAENETIHKLTFILEDYTFLRQIAPSRDFLVDDFCLSAITFLDSDYRDDDYALIERQYPKEDDDIIFSFESDRVIRVNCKTATLRIE